MLSKKLLFLLSFIILSISIIASYVFKVEKMSFDITKSSIQSKIEPDFYLKNKLHDININYEILNPTVKVLDTGEVSMKSELTLESGADTEWGDVDFTSTVTFNPETMAFYLRIPEKIQLKVNGKNSNQADFKLWNKDVTPLVADITKKMNDFLAKEPLYALRGAELRNAAESLWIGSVTKTSNGLNIILDVDQGNKVYIIYFVMFLSVFIFTCAYFLVGGVGFKDAKNVGFRDPRDAPRGNKKYGKMPRWTPKSNKATEDKTSEDE